MRSPAVMDTAGRPGIVYLAVNRTNQKAYVGITTERWSARLRAHRSDVKLGKTRYPFHRALRKYGFYEFDFAVVESCANQPELREAERRWVAMLGCAAPHGYNLAVPGGGGVKGSKNPKASEMCKLRIGHLNPNYGRRGFKHSEESIQAFREAQNRPEVIEANRKRGTKFNIFNNPDKRSGAIDNLKRVAASQWGDPDGRAKKIAGLKAAWERRRHNPKVYAAHNLKISESTRRAMQRDDVRKRFMAAQNKRYGTVAE